MISYRGARKTKNGPVMCALDTANKTTTSSSLEECSLKCGRDATCTGINIKNSLTCEVYNYRPKITSLAPDCIFYQVDTPSNLMCLFEPNAIMTAIEVCNIQYILSVYRTKENYFLNVVLCLACPHHVQHGVSKTLK